MILRRITHHVKRQNWFAVCLDFCIVVVGILIAFQITNWNEARQDNLLYEQARQRVIEEAKLNLVLAQDHGARASAYQTAAREILNEFENCRSDVDAGARERLMERVKKLRFVLGADVRDDAITRIISSDSFLDNISPQDLTTLSTYARQLRRVADNIRFDYSYQIAEDTLSDVPIFKRTSKADWGDGLMALVLTVSYQEACQNAQFNTFLNDRYEHATYQILQQERLAEASRELLLGLGESVHALAADADALSTTQALLN